MFKLEFFYHGLMRGCVSLLAFAVFAQPSFATPAPNWNYELDPQAFLYADVHLSTRIVNLMKFDPNTYKMDPTLYPEADNGFDARQDSLTLGNYVKGFQVFREKGIEIGPGFTESWKFSFPSLPSFFPALHLNVGVAPIVGKSVFTEQFAKDKDSIKELPKIKMIPQERGDLNQWNDGDAVTVQTSGGIVFYAGISQFPFSLSVVRIAKGTWTHHVRKISKNEVYVRITKDDLTSLSEIVSASIVSLRLTQFQGEDRNFGFKIDLSQPEGWNAYKDLMFGNLAGVQRYISENQFNGFVETVNETEGKYAGKIASFWFGIPILINETNTKAEIQRNETILTPSNHEVTKVNYGVAIAQKTVHHLAKTFDKRNVFWVGQYDKQDAYGKTTSSGILGEYSWGFEGNSLQSADLDKVIHRLIMTTGLYKQLKVNLPEVKNLGSISMILRLRIPPTGIATLISRIGRSSRAQFKEVAEAYCKAVYHASVDNDLSDDLMEEGSTFCYANTEISPTFKAIDKMWTEIQTVYNDGQTDKLSSRQLVALARFGRAMATSAVTFQTALGMMGENVYLDYEITGSRLNQYHVRFLRNSDAKFMTVESPEGSKWDSNTTSDDFTLPSNGTMISVPRSLPLPKTR